MSDALQVEIENIKENYKRCQQVREKEEDIIYNKIHGLRKESREEREKMENRISLQVGDIKKDNKSFRKKFTGWLIGVGAFVIVGLLGIVGFFLNFVFNQILSRLPVIP